MKNFWNDGSSALSNYYPTMNDRKREMSITIEYIHAPINTPITKEKAPSKAVRISTATLHIGSLGLWTSIRWLNQFICCLLLLLLCMHGVTALFSGANAGIIMYLFGVHAAIDITLIILIYQYNITLLRKQESIAQLRKRKNIILSIKQGALLMSVTLGAIYCILSPGYARIVQYFLS